MESVAETSYDFGRKAQNQCLSVQNHTCFNTMVTDRGGIMARDLETKQAFAKNLQENPTKSEQILKNSLIKGGYSFKFNEILFGYIPDFYFPSKKKIVELDGKQFHNLEQDKRRDSYFAEKGIQTFRIRSRRVFTDLRQVLRSIDVFLGNPVKIKLKKKPKLKPKKVKKKLVPRVLKGFRRIK